MVIPQVYDSVVGLVQAIPDYIEVVQGWLQTFFEDNPDIQASVMSIYNSSAASLEQWLNADILPNLESTTTALEWVRKDVVPNLTGVMAGVSGMVVGFLVLVKDLLIPLLSPSTFWCARTFLPPRARKLSTACSALTLPT